VAALFNRALASQAGEPRSGPPARLIRADDLPIGHALDGPYVFGLQDTQQEIFPSAQHADGSLVFDFNSKARPCLAKATRDLAIAALI
jgi:hypothetical protein